MSLASHPADAIYLRALYTFHGVADFRELSFLIGDRLRLITDQVADGWMLAETDAGEKGLVPRSYVVFEDEYVNEDEMELDEIGDGASAGAWAASPPSPPGSIHDLAPIERIVSAIIEAEETSDAIFDRGALLTEKSDAQAVAETACDTEETRGFDADDRRTVIVALTPKDDRATLYVPLTHPSEVSEIVSTSAAIDSVGSSEAFPTVTTTPEIAAANTLVSEALHPIENPQSLQRASTRRARRQLNRFSSYVTSGCEEFVLAGGAAHSTEAATEERKADTKSHNGVDDCDRHFIKSGPSWSAKGDAFHVRVHDPERRSRMGGMQEYTLYHIPGSAEVTVCRRFRQFHWLHLTLTRKYAALVLPPLPEKQFSGRFVEEFVERRRRALERFINRLVRHPVIRYSALLVHFLTCTDDAEWKRKEKAFNSDPIVGHRFFQHVYHPEFNVDEDGDVDAVQRFYDHIRAMDRYMPSFTDSAQGYRDQLKETQSRLKSFAFGMLRMISGAPDEDDYARGLLEEDGAWCWRDGCRPCLSLTKALQSTSDAMHHVSGAYDEHIQEQLTPWLESVKEYSSVTNALFPLVEMHVGAHRKFSEIDAEAKLAEEAGRDDYDAEDIKSRCETVFNVTLAELDRVHTERGRDFRDAAVQFIDTEIVFHEKIVAELRKAREVYAANAYASLSTTPRQTSPYTKELRDLPMSQSIASTVAGTAAVGVASVAGVRTVVGGVVEGVGTVGNYLSESIRGAAVAGTESVSSPSTGARSGMFGMWSWTGSGSSVSTVKR